MITKDVEDKMQRHMDDFKKRRIPICWRCEEDMEKVEESSGEDYSVWKYCCKCVKDNPELTSFRLNIG